MPQNLISSKEISQKYHIPYSTITHYTNLGLLRVIGRQGNRRVYREEEVRERLEKIKKMANEGYPLRLMRDKIFGLAAVLIFTLLFLLTPIFAASQDQGADLNLSSSISIAFKNNKDIQMQEKEIMVARAGILDARSRFLPNINFTGTYTYNEKVFLPSIFTGFQNDNLLGLGLSESIYSGGANLAGLRQSQLGLTVQEETLRAKKLDVEFEAKRLYYGLLLAYENERIAVEALGQAKAHYENVAQLYGHGRASRFDLLQSKVQVSLLEPPVIRAGNDIESLKAELNKLLARRVYFPITIAEKLSYTLIEIKEEEFLKVAYLDKPELKLKALGVDIDKWGIKMANAGYRPQVNMNANYLYRSSNTGHIIGGGNRNWNAGLSVQIPIFEGFSTQAKVDAAKARFAEAKLDKDNLSDQIAVDIRNACLNLNESAAVIKSQQDNVGEAREALRISEVSYTNGVATNLDVLDSQVSLAQIQTNLAGSTYDYLMAEAYLDRTMGKPYLKETKNEKSEKGR